MRNPSLIAPAIVAAALLLTGALPAQADDTYEIDPTHTVVTFSVEHLGVSRFHGRFNKTTGQIVTTKSATEGSVEVEVDAASIDTASEKRDKHLRGPDFFNAKQFKSIAFKGTGAAAAEDGTFEVKGELTLLGVTKEITAKGRHIGAGKDPWGGYRAGYEIAFSFRRSEFGMKYMLGGLGDEVDVVIAVEAIKK